MFFLCFFIHCSLIEVNFALANLLLDQNLRIKYEYDDPIKEISALPILFFSLAFYESNNFTSLEDQQKTRQTVLLQNLTSNHLSVLDIEINGYMCFFSIF